MSCPDPNLIAELAAGVLDEPERSAILAHLTDCEACRSATGELERGVAVAEPTLPVGAAVGRYLVLAQIGAGAMGAVYAAYDPELDRKVALKLLHHHDGQARLVAEGRAMARLAHPNVVPVLDLGTAGDGRVFVAMEFVDGVTLRRWLASGRRSWREIVAVLVEAGRGLAAAHAEDLAHRDFKPENLLIGRDGRTRVTDFGLARVATAALPGAGGLSARALELAGTPAYMAPEQFRCSPATARSDQFSFCVVLWEALYGRRPFGADEASVEALVDAVLSRRLDEPARGGRVPSAVRRLLLVGLATDPAARFPSMEALLSALERVAGERRRAGLIAVAAAAAIAAAAGVVIAKRSSSQLCGDAGGPLAAAWSSSRRAAIGAAFRGSGLPYAATTWAYVEPTLDAWARAFVAMSRQSCEATEVARTQSREVLLLRERCLDERQAEFTALADFLAKPTPSTIEHAAQAAAALRPVADCADVKRLAGPVAPAPAAAAESASLRRQLAALRARTEVGAVAEARADLTRVAERARAIGDRPLEAEALVLRVKLEYVDGANDAAQASAQAAVMAAEVGRDDRTRALAWIWQIPLADERGGRKEVTPIADQARAVLTRVPDDAEVNAAYETKLGIVEHNEGSPAEARVHLTRAIAISERRLALDSPQVASLLGILANALMAAGDYDGAEALMRRALTSAEKSRGRDHPAYANAVGDQANLALNRGLPDQAIALSRDALARTERLYGPRHSVLVWPLDTLNTALRSVGRLREALEVAERMYAIGRQEGPDSSLAEVGLLTIGGTQLAAHRLDEAERALDQTLAIVLRRAGATHPDARRAKIRLAAVYLARRQIAKARVACGDAARDLSPTDEWGRGDAEHCFAKVEEAEGSFEPALDRLRLLVASDEKKHVGDAPWGVGADVVAIGRLLARLGRDDEAARWFERALAGEPPARVGVVDSMVEARLALARLLTRRDPDRAARLAAEASALLAAEERPDPALVTAARSKP